MEKEFTASLEEMLPLITEQLALGKCVKFAPYGTSMLPMLRQGIDKVVFAPVCGKLKKYDLPLYRRDDGKFLLHRIVAVGETYTCMGDNQFTCEQGIRQDQVIAVVTGFYRKERYYSVENLGYRCYCRVWHFSRPVRHFWRRGWDWLRRNMK
jgi:hypothetical protein